MRKQLSQPSFVNGFARSKGESVRPDLWPDHAWIPALGCQGGTLYDVAGGRNAVSSGATWGGNYLETDYFGNDYIDTGYFPTNQTNLLVNISITNAGLADSSGSYIFGSHDENNRRFFLGKQFVGYGNSSTGTPGVTTGLHTYIMTKNSSGVAVYDNGSFLIQQNGTFSGISTKSLYICNWNRASDPNRTIGGKLNVALVYHRTLSQAHIISLSVDPLLPFRRKTFVSFYLPSGVTYAEHDWGRYCNRLLVG